MYHVVNDMQKDVRILFLLEWVRQVILPLTSVKFLQVLNELLIVSVVETLVSRLSVHFKPSLYFLQFYILQDKTQVKQKGSEQNRTTVCEETVMQN